MAHSLKPDGSLSRRLKVNLVELDGGSPAKNASKANGTRQLKLLHCPLAWLMVISVSCWPTIYSVINIAEWLSTRACRYWKLDRTPTSTDQCKEEEEEGARPNDLVKLDPISDPSLPYHTLPHHTLPHLTLPHHTIPNYILPHRTLPYHTIPYHTISYHALPYYTIPYLRHGAKTNLAE